MFEDKNLLAVEELSDVSDGNCAWATRNVLNAHMKAEERHGVASTERYLGAGPVFPTTSSSSYSSSPSLSPSSCPGFDGVGRPRLRRRHHRNAEFE